MNGKLITHSLRLFFGVFMICVYLGMAVLMAINFFEWSATPLWTLVRWVMAAIFATYGIYRGYRQFAGVDYYRNERFENTNDENNDDE